MNKVSRKIKTPVGELRWAFIMGDGRDVSDEKDGSKMKKEVSVIFKQGSKEAEMLKAEIAKVWEEFKTANPAVIKKAQEPKSQGYKVVTDKDTGEPTDEISFKFSTNSFYQDGKPAVVPTYDAKGNKFALHSRPGNGSLGLVFGTAAGYIHKGNAGITLYLTAIQIAKLVEATDSIEASDLGDIGEFEAEVPEI